MVNAENPLSILLGSSEQSCRVMELTEDMSFMREVRNLSVHVSTGTSFRAIHDRPLSSTIEVLVPGCGVRSIDRDKVRPEAAKKRAACLQCLEVHPYVGLIGFDGLLQLLEVVGGGLPHLMITREDICEDFETEDISIKICAALRACPNLQSLKLEGIHALDVAMLGDFYETNACQVSVLEFSKLKIDSNDSVTEFFKGMSQSSGRMSQQIRELRVELCRPLISTIRIFEIQEMLVGNRTLEVFMLGVSKDHVYLLDRAINLLPPVYVPAASKPLALRSRLAFVSVIHAPSLSSRALSRLDSRILSTIFAFAAPLQKRFFHVDSPDHLP